MTIAYQMKTNYISIYIYIKQLQVYVIWINSHVRFGKTAKNHYSFYMTNNKLFKVTFKTQNSFIQNVSDNSR